MAFSKPQIKMFAADLRREVGDGWEFMVPRVQQALVDQKALQVIRAQGVNGDQTAVRVAEMDALVMALRAEFFPDEV